MTSRNAFLGDLQERVPEIALDPTLALSLIVEYYYIDINANVNYLINFVMDNPYSSADFCLRALVA